MSKNPLVALLSLVFCLVFWSGSVFAATRCVQEDENGNCVSYEITDTRLPIESTSGGGWRPTGGGTGGGGGTSAAQDTAAKITGVIKKAKDLCKKESEDCGSWGSRMTAPQPAGSGFCTNISAALPLIGTAVCINTVNQEVNLNYCANVGCP
jgi:hypothetical protein